MPQRSNLFKSHWSNQWLTFCAVIVKSNNEVVPRRHLIPIGQTSREKNNCPCSESMLPHEVVSVSGVRRKH